MDEFSDGYAIEALMKEKKMDYLQHILEDFDYDITDLEGFRCRVKKALAGLKRDNSIAWADIVKWIDLAEPDPCGGCPLSSKARLSLDQTK